MAINYIIFAASSVFIGLLTLGLIVSRLYRRAVVLQVESHIKGSSN